jgi:hypothetical protein
MLHDVDMPAWCTHDVWTPERRPAASYAPHPPPAYTNINEILTDDIGLQPPTPVS